MTVRLKWTVSGQRDARAGILGEDVFAQSPETARGFRLGVGKTGVA